MSKPRPGEIFLISEKYNDYSGRYGVFTRWACEYERCCLAIELDNNGGEITMNSSGLIRVSLSEVPPNVVFSLPDYPCGSEFEIDCD